MRLLQAHPLLRRGGAGLSGESPPDGLAERLARIRGRIEDACGRAGRPAGGVTLLGASKTQPAPVLAEAFQAGLRVFGENRVQEGLAKSRELPPEIAGQIDWHLIGPLQSNKVRSALELFRTIHSVDRSRIAAAIDREAGARGLAVAGFLEVNLGGEESKHGFPLAGLAEAILPAEPPPAPADRRPDGDPSAWGMSPRRPAPGSAVSASCATTSPPAPNGPASPAGSRWG